MRNLPLVLKIKFSKERKRRNKDKRFFFEKKIFLFFFSEKLIITAKAKTDFIAIFAYLPFAGFFFTFQINNIVLK